ncbi:MAG: glycosyltransferase [Paludibacteraceae bacterium]|nr:glycosyltransferase [Paludibacteraceae bacterium]
MRIAVLSRGIPTAAAPMNGIFEWDQARALRDAGHDVRFLVLDYRRVLDRPMGWSRTEREGIPVFAFSFPTGMYRHLLPWLQRRASLLYDRMAAVCGPADVVHAHFYFIGALAAGIKRRHPEVSLVLTEHSSKLARPLEAVSRLDRHVARTAYAAADGLLCVSAAYQNRLRGNFGLDFVPVPNVVDLSSFPFAGRPAVHTPFRWVSAGLLIERKRMRFLLQAFAQAFPEGAELDIIGDGPQRPQLEQDIARLGLERRVRLHGMLQRADMAERYRRADAFVLLSASETFGVSFVEAMAMGLPVVATASGGPEEFIRPADGLVVPVDDEAAAVHALRQMYDRRSEYDDAAIAAGCRERFSPEAVAGRLTEYYQTLCNRK